MNTPDVEGVLPDDGGVLLEDILLLPNVENMLLLAGTYMVCSYLMWRVLCF
jgi:hypothetical protein